MFKPHPVAQADGVDGVAAQKNIVVLESDQNTIQRREFINKKEKQARYQHQIQHGMMLYIHKKTVEFMPQSGFGSQSAGRYSRCVKCHLHCKTLSFHSAAGAFRAVCSLISIVVRASVVVNITKFRFLVRSLCNCCSIQRRCRLLTKIRPCLSAWAQKK